MKLRKRKSSQPYCSWSGALAGVLILFLAPSAAASIATFNVDVAAMVAHRFDSSGEEVNQVSFFEWDSGALILDISAGLFGTAAWPDPNPLVNQGPVETGFISHAFTPPPAFIEALDTQNLGLSVLLTDTDDAMFAIDFLSLTVDTGARSVFVWEQGRPEGGPNDGFGLVPPVPDFGDLPSPLPDSLPVRNTGADFDKTISSLSRLDLIPEPSSLALLACAMIILFTSRRRVNSHRSGGAAGTMSGRKSWPHSQWSWIGTHALGACTS